MKARESALPVGAVVAAFIALLATACSEQPVASSHPRAPQSPGRVLQAFDCAASIDARSVSCRPARGHGGGSGVLIGGQNLNVRLTSSNVSYNAGTGIFQFDVTVQNLMNEAIGTPDGAVPDPDGIQVFFASGPTVTSGSGSVTVANADGTGTFTGTNQPYFAYNEIRAKDATTSAKTWQLQVTGTVNTFSFVVYVETDVQYLLVINEVLANPGGTISDANGEWFELYNA